MDDLLLTGDALTKLRELPSAIVQTCVTSPPYWNLRDYGVDGQMGLEPTPEAYVAAMVEVFREVKRVLKDDGTVWLNIGDSYAGYWGEKYSHKPFGEDRAGDASTVPNKKSPNFKSYNKNKFRHDTINGSKTQPPPAGFKPKDLIGVPWLLAFALRADGWYLRQDIIWEKPNPMPESINDRCTKSHEYIFLLSKSSRYYFDAKAISEPCSPNTQPRISQDLMKQIGSERAFGGMKKNGNMKACKPKFVDPLTAPYERRNANFLMPTDRRNKRSVWTVASKSVKEAHFATFPQELVLDCVKAGSRPGDIVLDPFSGTGTVAIVARKLDRHYIAIELNPKSNAIAKKRLYKELGMFK